MQCKGSIIGILKIFKEICKTRDETFISLII